MPSLFPSRTLAAVAASLALSGCASLSPDGGYSAVRELAQARSAGPIPAAKPASGDPVAERQLADLLARPLTVESAVQLALLNTAACRLPTPNLASPRRTWYRPAASATRCSVSGA